MYELDYVKKRKKKIVAAYVGSISAVVVAALIIIAFLGRFTGTFTVSLESKNVTLALTEKSNSETRSSYLRVNVSAPFHEYTYSSFEKNYGDAVLDSDETSYYLGAIRSKTDESVVEGFNFFKYTFFVENVGSSPAKYDLNLNILDNVLSDDGRSLVNTMRVMVYEDGAKTVYAVADTKPHVDAHGASDYRSPISVSESEATAANPFEGYAEMFASETVVTKLQNKILGIGEAKRYTVVTWLEGFRSSHDKEAPTGAKIQLGVEINAYENE